jgi:predicted nuclease with RNAse H fold
VKDNLMASPAFIGIDPTAGDRPIHYAAVDEDLRLQALGAGDEEAVLAYVAEFETAIVAIDAPQSPNQGLMLRPDVRRSYNLRPGSRTWGQWKVCEYELRRRNIRLYNTPARESDAPRWVRVGFRIYRRLADLGFRLFRGGERPAPRTMLEVHPHACYTVLLGRRPFLKHSLEGRLQRQLVLYMEGMDLHDPMASLEELTRHHLLNSQLPLDGVHGHDELDALVAAYTAYLVGRKPERVRQLGDPEEGMITLPVADVREFYS